MRNSVKKRSTKKKYYIRIYIHYQVNGGWGPWEPWGECSVSCGGGMKMKTRRCDSPPPSNGGKDCRGKSKKTRRCNRKSCCRNVWSKNNAAKQRREENVQWIHPFRRIARRHAKYATKETMIKNWIETLFGFTFA